MARTKLSQELTSARKRAKLTQAEAAEALEWSTSKITRIESGNSSVSVTDAKALIALYRIRGGKAQRLIKMARESHQAAYRHKPK